MHTSLKTCLDRSIVGWAIYENKSDEHAKEHAHPDFVHSDNGEPMKGITLVAFYYMLGIVPSFSRPRIFNNRNMVIRNARAAHPERWGSRAARIYEIRTAEVLNPAQKDVRHTPSAARTNQVLYI